MSQQKHSYKYLTYFTAAFITFYVSQEFLWARFVTFWPGYITGGTFVYFCSPLVIDVVTEVYGYKIAKQLLWCGLFALLFSGLCTEILFKMPYPVFWTKTIDAYHIALAKLPGLAITSSITIFIGQVINAYLISRWKILTRGKYFWLRSLGSSVIGDGTTIIICNALLLMSNLSLKGIMENLAPELIIMVSFTAIGAVPALFLAKFVAKAEGLNHYDTGVNFNPFKISDNINYEEK